MKKRSAIFFVVAVLIISVSAIKAGASDISYKDGTYYGSSFKFPGPMKVSVSIKDGRICDIKVLQHLAPQKHNNMLKPLINDIISKQSSRVDAVTGATMSSNALKRAVENALSKARRQE